MVEDPHESREQGPAREPREEAIRFVAFRLHRRFAAEC